MALPQLRLALGVLLVLALADLSIFGCSFHGAPPKNPAPFVLSARSHYSTEVEEEPSEGSSEAAGVRAVVLRQRPDAASDGRLRDLAHWAAHERLTQGQSPSSLDVDRISRQLGITAPFPMLLFVNLRSSSWSEDLSGALEAQPSSTSHNRLGVHVDSSGLAVVALASNRVSMAPVPRRIEPGQSIELEAELDPAWRRPEWLTTAPDGSVRRLSGALQQRLAGLEPGTHQIELLARGPFGLEVVANFPVGVGEEPSVENTDLAGIPWAPTVEAFLEAANGIRARAGLPPLQRDPKLERIAASHTRDMAEGRFFAHESPSQGSTHERMRRAGFPYQRYGENIGRARSSQEIHVLWLRSPGHRANLLDPGFTHVGLGVTTDGSAPPVILATQVFGGRLDQRSASRRNLTPPEEAPTMVSERGD